MAKNQKLYARIAEHGTIKSVARRANLNASTITGWIQGNHRPSIESLQKLSPVINVPVSDLVKITMQEG